MSAGTPRPSALISRATMLAVGVSGLFALTGCDTVARISFQSREFQSVRPLGFTPVGGSCDGTEGAVRFRTVFIANDRQAIRPGDTIAGQEVAPVEDDFDFQTGNLFSLPDVDCGGDGIMCESPFSCGIDDTASNASRCIAEATVTPTGDPTFLSDVTGPQIFGVLMENSASLAGFVPGGVPGRGYDVDGDGVTDVTDDSQRDGRESDPSSTRDQSLISMLTNYNTVKAAALDENRATLFGLFSFAGLGPEDVEPYIEVPSGAVFSESSEATQNAINAYVTASAEENARANVYAAMQSVLGDFNSGDYPNHEKTLVVFVDGPDDIRSSNIDAGAVVEAAGDVRIIIVHLDPSLDLETSSGTPLFWDDPDYWGRQDAPCADDSACRNYEECRVPRGVASTIGVPVEQSTEDTYCLPKRNPEDGRIGPIHDYARIACETGGGYLYVPDPDGLSDRMGWLPYVLDGLWELPASVDRISIGDVPSGSGYKLSSDLGVTIGGTSQPFSFSQGASDSEDTRGVIFTKP